MRIPERILAGAAVGWLLLSPPVSLAADPAAARKAIESANEQFGQAVQRSDAAGLAELYSEDGAVLPPDAPMIQGRKQIEAFWKEGLAGGIQGAKLETLEVEDLGDTAWERGTATLTVKGDGEGASEQRIKYLVVWKRQPDGSWKLHRDIWNALPAETPETRSEIMP